MKFFLLFLSGFSFAQNLVYNGGFEIYQKCPGEINGFEIEKSLGWKSPSKGTPDYFNSCSKNNDYSTPVNYIGKSETHAGNASHRPRRSEIKGSDIRTK